ncbi:MAG: DUF3616 domain-containing protein [Verrucomicrobia subdivision 3 bacterium]|nr:DUF3616 domain-containing protein [Limisphaerales bacterium]
MDSPVIRRAALARLCRFIGLSLGGLLAFATITSRAAGPWISEILFNPPGGDTPNEYVEIRATPNSALPMGIYLISVEGNTNANPGTIQNVFDLSGRTIGGNGFLVLAQNSNSYVAHAHATLVVNTNGPGWGSGSDSTAGHRGRSGRTDIENASITFFLLQASLAPAAGTDLDMENTGSLDNPIFATWTILDGVGVLDNDGLGDIGYGLINFRRNPAAIASGTIVPVGFTADYVARSGNTIGWADTEWVAGGSIGGSAPNWTLGSSGNTAPGGMASQPLNHIGAPNFGAPVLPGIVVTHSGNSTVLAENGVMDSYGLGLATPPNGTVTLLVSTTDGQAQVSSDGGASFGASRTINLSSTTPQTITLRAVDDNLIEMPNHIGRIVHSISSSTSASYPPGTLAPTVGAVIADDEFVLLSELKVNPPGTNEAPTECIEIRGTPGAHLQDIYVVVIEGDAGADPGTATMVVNLTGTTLGASGLLLIAAPGHPYTTPPTTTVLLDNQLGTPGGALGNGTISFFLASAPSMPVEGEDLDGGDNGVLEDLPQGTILIDTVAWTDGDTNDVTYGGVVLTQPEGTPDAATRFSTNLTPRSAAAWYCGDLAGSDPATLAYDSRNVSANFPLGTPLSPGSFNNTAPNVTPIAPISGVIGDPTNPKVTFSINDAESGLSGLTIGVSSANPLVVPSANLSIAAGPGGQRTLTINPIGVGYATIYIGVSDGIVTNIVELPYAASEMGRPGGVFHTGTADASAAIPIDANLMWVGDDENQIIRIYNRNLSGAPLAQFNMTPFLGLTDIENGRPREVDIEGATRVGNRIFWIGAHSHANIAEGRTNRSRVFGTDISGSGASSALTYVGRYDSLKLDLVNWDAGNGHGKGANYYGLAEATAEGVDPKTPMGFNIEGLCMAPGSTTTAWVALRAPIVPADNRHCALLVPVVNFTTVAVSDGPPGSAQFGAPIELDLFERGVRSIEGNGFGYLIVAGTSYDNAGAYPRDFRLFTWSGNPDEQPQERAADLTGMNPEAIVELPAGPFHATNEIHIISDNGRRIWYNDDIQAKFLPEPNFKKFRSDRVTLGAVVNSAPYIISNTISPTGITVTWRSRRNDRYQLEFKSALHEPAWNNVGGEVTATSPITSRFHPLPPGIQRFYRVIALP